MKNKILRKYMVIGTVLLFFGLGSMPSISIEISDKNEINSKSFNDNMLLIPDWTGDRVLAFDPFNGSFIKEAIPDDGNFISPKNAIASSRDTIFVSDQVADAVFEYTLNGTYIQTITNQASSDIDNIRGIAVYDNYLYVSVASGTWSNTIQKFDLNGSSQTTWATAHLSSPFDVFFRQNDVLISNSGSHDIDRYDFNGIWLDKFVDTGLNFPQQIHQTPNGNILVAGSFSPSGIYEYDSTGTLLNYYPIDRTMRGVYKLGNGLILFSSSVSVSTFDPATGGIVDIMTGGSYQFIEFIGEAGNYPPYIPSNPDPPDGATNVTTDEMSWTGGDPNPGDIVTYDVYFGTTSPPPLVATGIPGTVFNPIMNYLTTYYWKIVAWDNHGASTEGPIWSFTTAGPNNPPNTPSNPDPTDNETGVDIDADLSWDGGDPDSGDTVTYDVYFGTSSPPAQVVIGQSETTYDPGPMNYLTTYYWQIVSWDNHGASSTGPIWDFTTEEQPEPDLDCDGTLSWEDIDYGETVTGEFTIENIGDPESLLDWEIESYPEWGIWTFNPESGEDLTPEEGAFTVTVEVVAPEDDEGELTGEVKIINSENTDDYCIIDVTMTNSISQIQIKSNFFRIIQSLNDQNLLLKNWF